MKSQNKYSILERRIRANELLPPLKTIDDAELDIRQILIERTEFGTHNISDKQITKIKEVGYDAFVVHAMNSGGKIGGRSFHELCKMDKITLTFEYITFHKFRDKLKNETRIKIAKLLANNFNKSSK